MKEVSYSCPYCESEISVDILDFNRNNIFCFGCHTMFAYTDFICEHCFTPKTYYNNILICQKCDIRRCSVLHCKNEKCSHLLLYNEISYRHCLNLFSPDCYLRDIIYSKPIKIKTKSGKIINPEHYLKLLWNYVSNKNQNFIIEQF